LFGRIVVGIIVDKGRDDLVVYDVNDGVVGRSVDIGLGRLEGRIVVIGLEILLGRMVEEVL